MSRIRPILYPSDFSRVSEAAFMEAIRMAKMNGSELLVMHVLAPVIPFVGTIPPEVYDEIETSARSQAQAQIDRLVARAKMAGVRAKGLLLKGMPHEQITRVARCERAELVVIGTHGRTGLAKLILGSVAGRVMSVAPCPVLTVRGR
jgi:nucleotide-binding universal stress UspA family protein